MNNKKKVKIKKENYEEIINYLKKYKSKIKTIPFDFIFDHWFGFHEINLINFLNNYKDITSDKINNIFVFGPKKSGKKTLLKLLLLNCFNINYLMFDEYNNYFSFYKNYFFFISNQNSFNEEEFDKILIHSSLLIYVTSLLTNQEIEKILNISKRINKLKLKKKIVIIQNIYQINNNDLINRIFRKFIYKNIFAFKKYFYFMDKYDNIYFSLFNLFFEDKKNANNNTIELIIDIINDNIDFINKIDLINFYFNRENNINNNNIISNKSINNMNNINNINNNINNINNINNNINNINNINNNINNNNNNNINNDEYLKTYKELPRIIYKKEENYFLIIIFIHSSESSIEVNTILKEESIINIKIFISNIKKKNYFKKTLKKNIKENNNISYELNFHYRFLQIINFNPEIEQKNGIILIKYNLFKNSLI